MVPALKALLVPMCNSPAGLHLKLSMPEQGGSLHRAAGIGEVLSTGSGAGL